VGGVRAVRGNIAKQIRTPAGDKAFGYNGGKRGIQKWRGMSGCSAARGSKKEKEGCTLEKPNKKKRVHCARGTGTQTKRSLSATGNFLANSGSAKTARGGVRRERELQVK